MRGSGRSSGGQQSRFSCSGRGGRGVMSPRGCRSRSPTPRLFLAPTGASAEQRHLRWSMPPSAPALRSTSPSLFPPPHCSARRHHRGRHVGSHCRRCQVHRDDGRHGGEVAAGGRGGRALPCAVRLQGIQGRLICLLPRVAFVCARKRVGSRRVLPPARALAPARRRVHAQLGRGQMG